MAAQRPDDSGQYDDETLLEIIAERFAASPNEITRRDAAWLVELGRDALKMTLRKRVKFVDQGVWAGDDDAIRERVEEITADEAEHAAEDIEGAIGRIEMVTISGWRAVDAVAGLRRLARELREKAK